VIIHDKEERYVVQIDRLGEDAKSPEQHYWVTVQAISGEHFIMDEAELQDLWKLLRKAWALITEGSVK